MKWVKRIVLFLFLILIISGGTLVMMGYQEYHKVTEDTSIETYVAEIQQRDDYVKYDNISNHLLDATVAIEDRRFFKHNGIDIIGIGRAIMNNMAAKDIVGGGSSITQQLAKNLYFDQNYSLKRKIAEAFIAWELENKYTKNEILELYVNIINYGDNHIGIYQASMGYFGVEPVQLTIAQASLLAGLPQSPSNFQLSNHYDSAKIRQSQVLEAMVKEAYISELESKEAADSI